MSYFGLINHIVGNNLNHKGKIKSGVLNEVTTMGAISYLPSHLGMVKAKIADLAKKKKDWQIEILEDEGSKEVSFEDELRVIVPNEHWDSFCSIFDGTLDNNAYLNLNTILNETMEEEMETLRRELRVALASLYDGPEFRQLNQSSSTWRWRFGVVRYVTKEKIKSPVTQENRLEDIQVLYRRLLEQYGEDRGGLEMMIEAIKEKSPLNTFRIFKDYDFLYATRIFSRYQKVEMYFEATVDTAYYLNETILIPKDEELLDKIEEESQEVKVVRSIVYPKGGKFTSKFLRILSDIIEESE